MAALTTQEKAAMAVIQREYGKCREVAVAPTTTVYRTIDAKTAAGLVRKGLMAIDDGCVKLTAAGWTELKAAAKWL